MDSVISTRDKPFESIKEEAQIRQVRLLNETKANFRYAFKPAYHVIYHENPSMKVHLVTVRVVEN